MTDQPPPPRAWDQAWIEALPDDRFQKYLDYCRAHPPASSLVGRSRCRKLRQEAERRAQLQRERSSP